MSKLKTHPLRAYFKKAPLPKLKRWLKYEADARILELIQAEIKHRLAKDLGLC